MGVRVPPASIIAVPSFRSGRSVTVSVLAYISQNRYSAGHARVRRPRRPCPAPDPGAARRWRAARRGGRRGDPGGVRHLPAGRLAASAGAARERLRDRPAPRARAACTPWTRRRSEEVDAWLEPYRRFWTRGSTRWAPRSHAASAPEHPHPIPRAKATADTMTPPDRDLRRARARAAASHDRRGRSASRRPHPHLRDHGRGSLGRVHQSRAAGRWYAPVCGDLRLGGTFQQEHMGSGTIDDCDAPRFLKRRRSAEAPTRSSCGSRRGRTKAPRRSSCSTRRRSTAHHRRRGLRRDLLHGWRLLPAPVRAGQAPARHPARRLRQRRFHLDPEMRPSSTAAVPPWRR